MTLFMFVGQGVDLPWVSPEVLQDRAVARYVALASDLCGVDIVRLLSRGGRDLERSSVIQPAMVAVCLGVHRMLERAGMCPSIVLGHSLGEITAWAAAGGINDEDAVKVAALRGVLMDREAKNEPGGMLRIMGDRDLCERAVALGSKAGWMSVGAHNGPGEWVVSGDEAALMRVVANIASIRLRVSGAWHSPAMVGAYDELVAALAELPRHPMTARMVVSHDGSFAKQTDLPELLAGQLIRPVQWAAAMRTIGAASVRRIVAVGPGKVLRALVHRNLGVEREVEIIDSARAVEMAAAR